MALQNESYIGSAIVYVNGRDVFNASSVRISHELETKSIKNYRGGGGNADELTQISSVRLSMTLHDFKNDNLALALRGTVDVITPAAVVDEQTVAVQDGIAEVAGMIDLDQTVTVKTAGDVTLTVDTDYTVVRSGIKMVTGGAITDGDTIKVSYTTSGSSALQALTESGTTVPVVVDGINESTGAPFVFKFYRWKPSPTTGFEIVSDDFAEFALDGEVIADETKTGTGVSKFYKRIA